MAKKSTPKKAVSTPPKKKVVKKPVASKPVVAEQPFLEFRVTQQTLYWAILGAASITFALWLYSLDAKVRDLYDQIDAAAYSSDIRPAINEQPEASE